MNVPQPQRQATEQPAKAKSGLDVFLTLSLDLVCIYGQDGYFKQLNPAWEKVLGWTQSELRSQPWIEFVHPNDVESTQRALHWCNQDDLVEYENRYRHKDGSYRWLFWRVAQAEDGLYGVAKDTTATRQVVEELSDHNRIESALIESEERWKLALQANKDAIWDWNIQTNQCFHSARWREMLGYEEHEFSNYWDDWQTRVHPDDLERVMQVRQDHLERKTPQYIAEYRVRCKDGSYKWILSRAQAVWDKAGNPVRVVGSHTDISKRKRAEEALRGSEEQFRTLVANIPGVVYRCAHSEDWQGMFISDAIENLCGYPASDFACGGTRTFGSIIYPEDVERVERVVDAALRERQPFTIEYRIVHVDGSLRWVSERGQGVFGEQGEFLWLDGVIFDISHRKQAEAALQKAYQRLALHVDNSPLAVMEWDRELRLQRWSQQAEKMFGWKAEELLGLHFGGWSFIYEEDVELVNDILRGLMNGTQQCAVDSNRNYTKDGRVVYCEWHNSVLFDESGKVVSLLSLCHDVTDRKRAEAALQQAMVELETRVEERTVQLKQANEQLQVEIAEHLRAEAALRQSEEQFRRVFDEAPIGMALEDVEKRFIRVNRAFCEMLGYTKSELMSLTCADITHAEDWEQEIPRMEQLMKGEIEDFQLEKRYLKKNQEILWVNVTAIVLRDEAGEILQVLAMVEDITQRKQAVEALRLSEEQFRRVFDEGPIGMSLAIWENGFFRVNQAFCEMLGYSESELMTLDCEDITYSEDWQQEVSYRDRIKKGEIDSFKREKRYVKKNQEIFWVNLTLMALRNEAGEILYALGMVEDITERKQAEAEMLKALEKERELGELRSGFVSLVSHEFRTPLTTIQSSAELVQRYSQKLSDERKLNHLIRIQGAVKRMTQLLEDVLTIGRAEAGKLEFQPAPMDLAAFCHKVVENMQELADEEHISSHHQHRLTLVTQGDCSNVQMDAKLLEHIVSNLLSNGLKYSPEGGTVQFDLICDGESAVFHIRDCGIGIPQKDLEQLFESFRRASNVGTIPGTGLGLAIVKKCVELHGGTITVDSVVGTGTTFTVTLPLHYQPSSDVPSAGDKN